MTDEKNVQQDIPLKLIHMNEIQATDTQWLWYPYIPYGKITIIQGDPGEGKTTLVLHLAAELTRGEMIGTGDKQEPVTVIYQTAEDGLADTIKPRLIAANADCSKVIVIDEREQCVSMTDGRLEVAIQQTDAKLVILDPIQAYLGAAVDMHRANEVRPIMSHLAGIAEKYGCAIVLIGHMNKASGQKASYRGLGSIDFAAAARSVLIVARDRVNPKVRVMIHAKSSLAPEGKPVAFELDKDSGFRYLGEYWYRGVLIARAKGGDLYNAPELQPVTDEQGIIPFCRESGNVLLPIDIEAMCAANKELLTVIEDSTVKKIVKEYEKFNKKLDIFHVAFSGGKDSAVLLDLVKKALPKGSFVVIFGDTGMEFPDTYAAVEYTKQQCAEDGTPFYIARSHFDPQESWKIFAPPARVQLHEKVAKGTIRISLGKNNTKEEVHILVQSLFSIAKRHL